MAKEIKKISTEPKSNGGAAGKYIFIFLFVVLLISFAWYYMKYQKAEQQIYQLTSEEGRQEVSQKEIDDVIKKVSKHIILPEGGAPTVATIEDAQALAEQQSFFTGSQNGDKVLIYSDKAIVYNPNKDLLVNVGPVYFQDNEGGVNTEVLGEGVAEEVTEEVEEVVKIISLDIRNGSQVPGKAQSLADSLSTGDEYDIANVANAVNKDYPKTVLVNLGQDDVSALEQSLGVSAVNVLPEGEVGASSNVVIILGNE